MTIAAFPYPALASESTTTQTRFSETGQRPPSETR